MEFQLNYSKSWKMMLWKCCTPYAHKFGKQQWPQNWKGSVFITITKKGNAKECSNYHAIALISHASKVMLKILQARLQQYVNQEPPDVKLVLEKAEEWEIKLPTSAGSLKSQENSRKTSISALLTMSKPLTVWITINCGKFWKRSEYQTTWPASWETYMQVRKQNYNWKRKNRLVPNKKRSTSRLCIVTRLFNLYAEYIMRNAGLEEGQAGIKIAWRNINNLRYADDTTLWQKVKKN